MRLRRTILSSAFAMLFACTANAQEIHGNLRKWNPVEVWIHGPSHQEHDNGPNPFLDYRLNVDFTGPDGTMKTVPGYFDGNGNGGSQGDVWKAIIAPDQVGAWTATASFRAGQNVNVSIVPSAGVPISPDGSSVVFDVAPRGEGDGFLSLGMLQYVGGHYLKFADGGYFLKGGVDSPENFLAHGFSAHGGPFGALDYLSNQGINSIYFLPMNLGGDAQDTFPWINEGDTTHFDLSKMKEWRALFDHAAKRAIMLHIVLAETESANESWLDGGSLGVERKLFYRELVARFGHHPAIKWNISEECDYSTSEVLEFAGFINFQDAYNHPITAHNHLNATWFYDALAGSTAIDATAAQYSPDQAGDQAEYYRSLSSGSGHPWVVEMDENWTSDGLQPWNIDELRKTVLWDTYLSGAGGLEWYFGGDDQSADEFHSREAMWRYTRIARGFLQRYCPFHLMQPADGLLQGESGAFGGGEVFALLGQVYAVYVPDASPSGTLDLSAVPSDRRLRKRWFNPRAGRFEGTESLLLGGGPHALGNPPGDPNEDWAVLLTRHVP